MSFSFDPQHRLIIVQAEIFYFQSPCDLPILPVACLLSRNRRLSRSGFQYIPVAERDFWRVFGLLVPFGDRDVLGHRPNPDLLRLLNSMGAINTTITLTNPANAKTHTMDALVDTGAVRMALPEDVVHLLGLQVFDTVVVRLATEETRTMDVAGPLFVELMGRKMATDCFVLPAASEALVGQVVLESLDLIADSPQQTVYPRHPQSPYPVLNLK